MLPCGARQRPWLEAAKFWDIVVPLAEGLKGLLSGLFVEAGEELGDDGGAFLAFDLDGVGDLDLGAALDLGDLGDGGLHADRASRP